MALASSIWDGPPPATSNLKLVANGVGAVAKPETYLYAGTSRPVRFNEPSIESSYGNDFDPMTLVRPAGRLDKVSIISQLDRLKGLLFDWNGYGAQPIDVELIDQAKRFVEHLPSDIVDTPAVVPMTRGRFQFEWHRGNRSLELEFESWGRLHYLKADDYSGIEEEDILLTSQTPEIEELLRWFSSE